MDRFMKLARRAMGKDSILGDERGLTTVEYVIILVLIAVMAISVWQKFGASITTQVGKSQSAIDSLDEPAPAGDAAPAPKK
jgi:Flp pilus assembly pilin Flp